MNVLKATNDKKISMDSELHILDLINRMNLVYRFNLWTKNKRLLYRCFYYFIPVFLFGLQLVMIARDGVFWTTNANLDFSFANDFTNLFIYPVLFFLSYYLSGWYPSNLNDYHRLICEIINPNRDKNGRQKVKISHYAFPICLNIMMFFCFIHLSLVFINGIRIEHVWNYEMSGKTLVVYVFLQAVTWICAFYMLVYAMLSSNIIYKSLQLDFFQQVKYINYYPYIEKSTRLATYNLSYGSFYFLGVILTILNDHIVRNKYSELAPIFSSDVNSIIMIIIALFLLFIALVPFLTLYSCLSKKKKKERLSLYKKLEEGNISVDEYKAFITRPVIFLSKPDVLALIGSIVIPLIGIIIQLW